MDRPLPPLALWLGLSGLLPFLALSLAVLLGWTGWAGFALLAYGATILAFLGAVHWGLALRAAPEEALAEPGRLVLGVAPSLVAWVALLLPVKLGLLLLAAAILAAAVVETLAGRAGLVPTGYLRLRWALSLGAVLSLGAAGLAG
jgi:hypothetical protein